MNKMRNINYIIFSVIILALILPLADASVSISSPNPVYNLGDKLELSVSVNNGNSFLNVYLICNNEMLIYKEYLELTSEKKIDITALLDNVLLGENNTGNCFIKADFNSLSAFTLNFEITNKIIIALDTKKTEFSPGENAIFTGKAILANTKNLDGYAETSIEELGIQQIHDVKNGIFSFNLTIPETAKSKNYIIVTKVYDKKLNRGESSSIISVKQIPTSLEIQLNNQSFNPGGTVSIIPLIYDQAGDMMQGQLALKITNPNGETTEQLINNQEEKQLVLETNSPPGEWKISLAGLGLVKERSFYVNEKMQASFEFVNDSLIIKNIGNIPYKKTIEVDIGGEKRILEVELNLGGEKEFVLKAPDGQYNVKVSDGLGEASATMSLTGSAIGIRDVRGGISMLQKYPVVWLFLIAVFALFIFVVSKNIRKGSFILSEPLISRGGVQRISLDSGGKIEEKESLDEKIAGTASPSAVLKGHKQTSTILVIAIKNPKELGKFEEETLMSALSEIKKHKGSVYRADGFITVVFSPLITKTYDNDIIAVKVAADISNKLAAHNRKAKKRIEFGIGINSGEIIASFDKKTGKLDYTSLGKTVSEAKKIARNSEEQVLASQSVYHKVMSESRANKKGDYFEIIEVREREKYNKFVNEFLQRQKEEKK